MVCVWKKYGTKLCAWGGSVLTLDQQLSSFSCGTRKQLALQPVAFEEPRKGSLLQTEGNQRTAIDRLSVSYSDGALREAAT